MKIGVIGANGLVGKAICEELDAVEITRNNYGLHFGEKFDVLINANGNSSKWVANKYQVCDFVANVESVYHTMFDFNFKQYVYISSFDVHKNNIYGLHKRLAEMIVKYYTDYIILRCPIIIGKEMKKGFLYDALNDIPLYVNRNSEYQIISNIELAKIIRMLLEKKISSNLFYVGSINTLKINRLSTLVNRQITYRDGAQYENYLWDVSELKKIYPLKTAEEYIRDVI